MKITYHVATSQDGFIATEDGGVAWLDEIKIDMAETGLARFFAAVDGLVMGRGTYNFVFDYGSWPYEDKRSWVCTSKDVNVMDGANLTVADSIERVIAQASSENAQHLWLLGGGKLASSFLERNLVTDVSIAEMPVHLGTGIPVFANHRLSDLPFTSSKTVLKQGFVIREYVL